MISRSTLLIAVVALFTLPSVAQADMFSMYVSGSSGYVAGQGDSYDYFDQKVGSGAEAGLELLGVDIWGEALKMGQEQYLFTANLGFDLSFGKKWRTNIGLYTGPIVFMRPEEESAPFALSGTMRSALTAQGIDPTMVENEYNQNKADEDELNRYAFGWNLARTRIQFERELFPLVYLGLGGQVAYHYMVTGEEVAGEAKNTVADDLESRYGLDQMNPSLSTDLRKELGAEAIDREKIGGFNYAFNAYLKIEI